MGKKYIFFRDVTALITNAYIYIKVFFLAFYAPFCYHNHIVREQQFTDVFREGEIMSRFYYETWLPFIVNKRRILILAIASYIALC